MEWHAELVRGLGGALMAGEPLRELLVSSAYTSLKGARAIEGLIAGSGRRQAILGCNALTEWQALDHLADRGVTVQIMPDPPDGIFHPKCFYAEDHNGQAWLLAGSANLTEGGLARNIEAGIRLSAPAGAKIMKDTKRFFTDLAEVAAPLTPELLSQFRRPRRRSAAPWRSMPPPGSRRCSAWTRSGRCCWCLPASGTCSTSKCAASSTT